MKSIFQHLEDPSIIGLHEFRYQDSYCCYIYKRKPDTGLGEANRGEGTSTYECRKQAYTSTTPLFTFELDGCIELILSDGLTRPVALNKIAKE